MVVHIKQVCALLQHVAVGISDGNVGAVDEVECDVAVVSGRTHPAVAGIVSRPVPTRIILTLGRRHLIRVDGGSGIPGIGVTVVGGSVLGLGSRMEVVPRIVGIPVPVRAAPVSRLRGAVFEHREVELPCLALAYTAAEAGPEIVVYELGAEIIHRKGVGIAPYVTATGVDTHLHLIAAVERNLKGNLIGGAASLRSHPCHTVLLRHKALEMNDIGILRVMLHGESHTFHELLRRDVGRRKRIGIFRTGHSTHSHGAEKGRTADIFKCFCHFVDQFF